MDWALDEREQNALDKAISEAMAVPENWKALVIACPPDFFPIALSTIEAYKLMRETEKEFPAIEAIFMEARNSLPAEILDIIEGNGAETEG